MTTEFNPDELFPARFHNNSTFPIENGRVIQIAHAATEQLKDLKTGALTPKVVVSFTGVAKPIILNKTNFQTLVGAFGRDGGAWVGKSVAVHRVPISMNGTTTLAVRFVPAEPATSAA